MSRPGCPDSKGRRDEIESRKGGIDRGDFSPMFALRMGAPAAKPAGASYLSPRARVVEVNRECRWGPQTALGDHTPNSPPGAQSRSLTLWLSWQ